MAGVHWSDSRYFPNVGDAIAGDTFMGLRNGGNCTFNFPASEVFSWQTVAGTSQLVANDSGYITSSASLTTFTPPLTCAVGFSFNIEGNSTGGFIIQAGGGQYLRQGSLLSSSGGSVTSADPYNGCRVVCVTANTVFKIIYATTSGFIWA